MYLRPKSNHDLNFERATQALNAILVLARIKKQTKSSTAKGETKMSAHAKSKPIVWWKVMKVRQLVLLGLMLALVASGVIPATTLAQSGDTSTGGGPIYVYIPLVSAGGTASPTDSNSDLSTVDVAGVSVSDQQNAEAYWTGERLLGAESLDFAALEPDNAVELDFAALEPDNAVELDFAALEPDNAVELDFEALEGVLLPSTLYLPLVVQDGSTPDPQPEEGALAAGETQSASSISSASLNVYGDFNSDGRDDLAIGVPDEDIGSIIDAGVVQVFYSTAAGLSASGNQLWHQDSPGVQDAVEPGDHFGNTLR